MALNELILFSFRFWHFAQKCEHQKKKARLNWSTIEGTEKKTGDRKKRVNENIVGVLTPGKRECAVLVEQKMNV